MSFRYLTAGESHGPALTGILEGVTSGLEMTSEYIHAQLLRRKKGHGRGARQKIESDAVEILSGVRLGQTLGSPIGLLIRNQDFRAWQDTMSVAPVTHSIDRPRPVEVPRPGHADLVGGIKYGHSDMRNVLERSSARETTMRVALASIARKFLQDLGIEVTSRVVCIGKAIDSTPDSDFQDLAQLRALADNSPVRYASVEGSNAMIQEIDDARRKGDTLGGIIEVLACGVPIGLGSYAQADRRLEGRISQAFMSLNAIKGVEIGIGFESASTRDSQSHDEYTPGSSPGAGSVQYLSNRSGGIDGGMSTGQLLRVRAAMKPLATPCRSYCLEFNCGETVFKKIYLTGFMGVGKSTVSRNLAARLEWEFVDLDRIIEREAGISITEKFASMGERGFRDLEVKALSKIVRESRQVVALGGGTILNESNRRLIDENGSLIYLEAKVETFMARLSRSKDTRPLLDESSSEAFLKSISLKLEERQLNYGSVSIRVETDELSPQEISETIISRLALTVESL